MHSSNIRSPLSVKQCAKPPRAGGAPRGGKQTGRTWEPPRVGTHKVRGKQEATIPFQGAPWNWKLKAE